MSNSSDNDPSPDDERVWPSGPHNTPPAPPAAPVPPAQPSQPAPPPGFQQPQPQPAPQPPYPQAPAQQPYPQAPQQPAPQGWSNQPPPGAAPQPPAGWQPGHQPQGWQGHQAPGPQGYGSYAPAPPPKSRTGLWIGLGVVGLLLVGVIGVAAILLAGNNDGDTETADRSDRSESTDDETDPTDRTDDTGQTDQTGPDNSEVTPPTGVDDTMPDDMPDRRQSTMSLELDDAVIDIEEYFAEVYPQLYGEPWTPVTEVFKLSEEPGGSVTCGRPVPVANNAFYCSLGHFVAYDDVNLFPFLEERFGELAPAMALAHEWAHAAQGNAGLLNTVDTVFTELQADCLAGAWSGRLLNGEGNMVGVSQTDIDLAIGGWIFLGDGIGIPIDDPSAHGTGFDRVGAFGDGIINGAGACVDYLSGGVDPVDIGLDDEFFETQGNLDFDTAIDVLDTSLDQYWDGVATDLGAPEPDPLTLVPVSNSAAECSIPAGRAASSCDEAGFVVYRDNWVGVHDQIGDFATALVVAQAYAEAVSDDLGFDPTTERLECLTGSWAGSTAIQLSAGDLDEAILTFIEFGGIERSVFDSVSSFQRGYFEGFNGCI